MKIGFAGLSHLGIVSSLVCASKGAEVMAFDADKNLCDTLARGELTVYEPGLDDIFKNFKKNIRFTSEVKDLGECGLIYFSKDISTDAGNQSDLGPTEALIESVLPHAGSGTLLVMLSQVPPGFMRKIGGKNIFYQVETLIFGNAVERAAQPERFIVGCQDPVLPLPALFKDLLGLYGCPVVPMRYESAELAKISINMCLAASVNTANTLAELCEAIGADWSEIVPALKTDKRIGEHAYLSPGLGLSGGNLERDLVTVKTLAAEFGTDAGIVDAWLANSEHRRDWVFKTLYREVLSQVSNPVVAVWGLSYKPDTVSVKNSPSAALLDTLSHCAKVRLYDPKAKLEATKENVFTASSALEACRGADVLVLMTPWKEFLSVPASGIASALKGKTVLDPLGSLDEKKFREAKLGYFRLGFGG